MRHCFLIADYWRPFIDQSLQYLEKLELLLGLLDEIPLHCRQPLLLHPPTHSPSIPSYSTTESHRPNIASVLTPMMYKAFPKSVDCFVSNRKYSVKTVSNFQVFHCTMYTYGIACLFVYFPIQIVFYDLMGG